MSYEGRPTLKRARSSGRATLYEPSVMDGTKKPRQARDVSLQSIATKLRSQLLSSANFGVGVSKTLRAFDHDQDGRLTLREFSSALQHMGYKLSRPEIHGLAAMCDAEGDGTIGLFEFLQFVHSTPRGSEHTEDLHWPSDIASAEAVAGSSSALPLGGGGVGSPGFRSTSKNGAAKPAPLPSPSSEEYVASPSLNALSSKVSQQELSFQHAKVALACAAQLGRSGRLTAQQKAALKDLIVRGDERVAAAAMVFDEDGDDRELLDTMCRIAQLCKAAPA